MGDLLIVHGGGPTAVINASLYGVIIQSRKNTEIDKIYASANGLIGVVENNFIDLTNINDADLDLLKTTPGSAIGTGRDHFEDEDYDKISKILQNKGIKYVLLNGGNGTMDTVLNLSKYCVKLGITVVGIPKTMDNDLSGTDHSPGFPSAARYLAGSVKELSQDVKGLAIHAVVIEAFGRDAGWVCSAAALARDKKGDPPQIILYPEIPFDEDHFLNRVKEIYEEKGYVVIVASEGLRYPNGNPIVDPVLSIGRSVYFGDVSAYLSKLIMQKLNIKARHEKPGLFSRASSIWVSDIDREEAILCGMKAVDLAIEGKHSYMPTIKRVSSEPYKSEIVGIKITKDILEAKTMPEEYFDKENYDVSDEFINWLKPLVKPKLQEFISFVN